MLMIYTDSRSKVNVVGAELYRWYFLIIFDVKVKEFDPHWNTRFRVVNALMLFAFVAF